MVEYQQEAYMVMYANTMAGRAPGEESDLFALDANTAKRQIIFQSHDELKIDN